LPKELNNKQERVYLEVKKRAMRVLITGGAGFLGSHLCDALIEDGNEVICVDNLLTGRIENIAHLIANKKFRFIEEDICDYKYTDGSVDAVLHFASPASPKDYLLYPIHTLKVGAFGTYQALNLIRTQEERFVLASTSEVYGDPLVSPQDETYWGNVNPISPRGVYDEAKRFAEAMVMAYHRYHGLDTRIVRIFNTYGPRMRKDDGRAISNFIVQALENKPITIYGDGTQTRSFCYVDDMVEGIKRLLVKESDRTYAERTDKNNFVYCKGESSSNSIHEPVNLGNPHELSILTIAEKIKEFSASSSPLIYTDPVVDDPRTRRPDISKAEELLNWEPRIGIEEGIKKTIKYFKRVLDSNSDGRQKKV
jgi:dTDP-glucose 4,6-dehydratase